ncbi:hypothetical protein BC828DRAFT_383113 [Blastocladiella britannica]|nr:hypothetical protein BC828DRAFT_383113 [Blastocladiella britannica]
MKDDEKDKLIYIDRVKLLLDEAWLVTDEGRELLRRLNKTTDEAIAELLQMLAESVKVEVCSAEKMDLNFHRVEWVLTVPAIWSNKAKSQMRKAMFLAELIPSEDSENLLLCLEPEAALISAASTSADVMSGDNVLVVDSGTHFLDVIVHWHQRADTT